MSSTNLCPHCKNELELPLQAIMNVEAYGNPRKVTTNCCGHLVRLSLVSCISATKVDLKLESQFFEDDWGRKFKRQQ